MLSSIYSAAIEDMTSSHHTTVTTSMASGDTTALDTPVVDNANTSPKRDENSLDNDTVTARCTTICSSSTLSIECFPSLKKKSALSFGSVNIHTHSLILGDNPAVSQGLPLALAWDHEDSMSFSLDEFEIIRETRPKKPLKISREDREAWLQEIGHTSGSFSRLYHEIYQIKLSREQVKQEQEQEERQEERQHFALLEYQVLSNVSLREYRRQISEVTRGGLKQSSNETASKSKKDANQEDFQKRRRRRLFGRWMKK
jgi:hypothetical protein